MQLKLKFCLNGLKILKIPNQDLLKNMYLLIMGMEWMKEFYMII